jgi:glycine/D-amino acid oxidase-like deaminating enzyme
VATVADQPTRSPWLAQLALLGPDPAPRPLTGDAVTGVTVVGAGIAGIATAFFLLRATPYHVLLVERDRAAHGATGRNGGQLTTYLERPLHVVAEELGAERAIDAQRAFDASHELLDLVVAESGADVRVERFTGHLGMWTLNHLDVHLRNNLVRRKGGLREEACVVSEDAEFLDDIPVELTSLFTVVPQTRVRELLETTDDRYRAVLSDRKGCINGALLVQQVLDHLESAYPDRFRYVDSTHVDRVVVGPDGVVAHAGRHTVRSEHLVLCTNGFVDHVVEDDQGRPVELAPEQVVGGRVAYMTAFVEDELRPPAAMSYIRNARIGDDLPYVYVTRRTYDTVDGTVTLTAMGGPEHDYAGPYDPATPFPGTLLAEMDAQVRPFAQPARPPGLPYDFQWHGLMGYTPGGVRVVGPHPVHSRLLYNLGCNGVGFLPSIAGAERLGRLLAGEVLTPSALDPRLP